EETETVKEEVKKVASKRLGKKKVKPKVTKAKRIGLSASVVVSKNTESNRKRTVQAVINRREKTVVSNQDKSLNVLEKLGFISAN
ncbi:MAG: hypothetical protein L6Q66_06900, partial [Bacteroidia bacterium]|nr:hypothetical protein [Bacteroidia bacterium]